MTAVLGLTLTGCGSGDAAAGADGAGTDGDVVIGLITKTDSNQFFVDIKNAAQAAADAAGAELIAAAGKTELDNASQVAAIESMVSRGVDGILITPADAAAIVPAITQARAAGVVVIALDTPTVPEDATDALFATDNFKAGQLIGQYAREAFADGSARIGLLDIPPGSRTGQLRKDGFLDGFGITESDPQVVGSANSEGSIEGGQTAMETLLQKDPTLNLVYAVNEPAALGGARALEQAGRSDDVMIVAIDGGCEGIRQVQAGVFAADSQQYPKKMAELGVEAVVEYAETGQKPTGYVDTGVTLITDEPVSGVPSESSDVGLQNCWG